MALSPSAVVELARLAFLNAHLGKHKASAAYSAHALAEGWQGTPAWVEGRDLYTAAWRRHRAAHLAATAPAPAQHASAASHAP